MNYGKALRIARAVSGLQQQELAERAGLNASHISLIEKGSRKPSVAAIEKLSKALEMPESLFTMLAANQETLRESARRNSRRRSIFGEVCDSQCRNRNHQTKTIWRKKTHPRRLIFILFGSHGPARIFSRAVA